MALDALDIFPLKCLWWAPVDHFDYMIMETAIAPAVLGVGVFGTLLFKGDWGQGQGQGQGPSQEGVR